MCFGNLAWPAFAAAFAEAGVPANVARRAFAQVHRCGAEDFSKVAGLRAVARDRLQSSGEFPAPLEVVERRRSADGFTKYLFRLFDGALVEAVRIPLPDPALARVLRARRKEGRAAPLEALPTSKYTVCVSSQVGCPLACDFCATGRLGGIRSLATWEIVAQVRQIAAEADFPVRGVVFMGMGEPFLNYDQVLAAAQIFSDPAGFAIAAKAITISTAGVVPMIRRYTAEGHRYRLIVSLGSALHEQRLQLLPIERRWPLEELRAALGHYAEASGDRVTVAYVALGGVNMSREHARALAAWLGPMRAKVSLIDVSDETGRYQPPSAEELHGFRDELASARIPFVRRYSGGGDIGAACGTLSTRRSGGEIVTLRC